MLNMNTINISGTSKIDGKDVVFFNALFSAEKSGNYSLTKNITDKEAYMANREQCEADYTEFDSTAMEVMKQVSSIQ